MPIALDLVHAVATLPALHDDPFDRLLVAQAATERLTLLSRDRHVQAYPVEVLWQSATGSGVGPCGAPSAHHAAYVALGAVLVTIDRRLADAPETRAAVEVSAVGGA